MTRRLGILLILPIGVVQIVSFVSLGRPIVSDAFCTSVDSLVTKRGLRPEVQCSKWLEDN